MQDATKTADTTICILSEDYLQSGFTSAEWHVAFADDPIGKNRKILPIRVRKCDPEGLLKTRIYVNLVGKDKDVAKSLVKQSLLDGRRKPTTEPPFPADHGTEPNFPNSKVRYAFVLDGNYDANIKERVENLIKHIQKAVNGASITITEITEGSMIINIESSQDAFRRLQREFFENPDFTVDNMKVLGIWALDNHTKKPVDQRLEFYRDRLIKYFLSEGIDKETAKDLTQDVLINVYTDANKYEYLSSASLIINLARIALDKYLLDKERDVVIRKNYISPSGEIDWDEVYRVSVTVLEGLPEGERFILEKFWDSRFVEGKFDHFRGEDIVRQIDSTVQCSIQANLDEDYLDY